MLALFVLSSAPSTLAAVGDPTCPHGGNATSSACLYGITQFGTYAEFHNNNMTLAGALERGGDHVNHSICAYSGSPCTLWVEEGLTQGYHGEVAYLWYYARNSSAGYADYRAGYTSPNGSNHAYRLRFNGSGQYTIFRDGATLAMIGGLGAGTCISTGGLEIAHSDLQVDGNYHSDTFDYVPLAYQDAAYNYVYSWNVNQSWNDQPCGRQGYAPPNCMNGTFYGASHWADNKP